MAFSFKSVPKRLYLSLGKKGNLGQEREIQTTVLRCEYFDEHLMCRSFCCGCITSCPCALSLIYLLSLAGFPAVAVLTRRRGGPAAGRISYSSPDSDPPRLVPCSSSNDTLRTRQRWIIKTAATAPRRAFRGGLFQNNEYGNSASIMNCKQSSNSLVPKIHTCLSHNLSLFFYYYCSICKQGQETLCSFVSPYICPLIPVSLPSPQHRQDYTKQKSLIFISDYLWAF